MKNSQDERKKRLDELLLTIGGLEESIRASLEQEDWDFVKVLRELKPKYHERLKRVAYGLPEETKLPADQTS